MRTCRPMQRAAILPVSALTLTCLLFSPVHAAEWLSVTVPAQYDTLTVPDHIRNDCIGLDRTVGVEVAYKLEKSGFAKVDRTEIINLKAPGKLLKLTITHAASSSGEFTNARSLTVKAELFQDGKAFEWVIKSNTIRGEKDMCDTMEKNAVAIAQDIHTWLTGTLHSKTLPANLDTAAPASGMAARMRDLQSRTLWIDGSVNYLPGVPQPRVINDCRVDSTIVDQAVATFSKTLTAKQLASSGAAAKDEDVLQFSIVDIKGGDDSTIEKRGMTLRAELMRNGNMVDSFNGANGTEHDGIFGQVFHTTCEALHDISSTMIKQTYQWYVTRNPSATKADNTPADNSLPSMKD